jgi:hypothetical protein
MTKNMASGLVQILVKKVMTAHALKLRDSYPEACNILIVDTYTDDTIVSRPNKVECVKLVALAYLSLRQIYITGARY